MNTKNKWHDAETDKPKTSVPILLRVEKGKNPHDVAFVPGYHSGFEYCSESERMQGGKVEITHYDRVTHWIELP